MVDEDEDAEAAPTDRAYCEKRGTKATIQLADVLVIARETDPSLELKYNKILHSSFERGAAIKFCDFSSKEKHDQFRS